jgi:hypothetical protein
MKILGFEFGKKAPKSYGPESRSYGGQWRTIYHQSYDGEKNLGEIGPLTKYSLDYEALRLRSWKAYLDSEVAQTVFNKFSSWVIGKGLRLQSEPAITVLKSEGIELNAELFNEIIESRFKIYSNSKMADYSGINSLNKIANTAFSNSKIGGDVLVILRVVNKVLKVQLVDGSHVCSPYATDQMVKGNRIINGIEIDEKGKHIAYYIAKENLTFERVPAYIGNRKMAYMVYGLRYRLDNHRGIPLISAVLETITKLERYKEATVGSAEELNKIAYQVVHQAYSSGDNPMAKNIVKAFDLDADGEGIPVDQAGKQLADTVAATTNKQAYNNPVGAKIETIDSGKRELYFKDFYTININMICSTLGIPPDIALSKYDSNYSASRAAIKDWEHTLNVERTKFTEEFYQPIYDVWLDLQVLLNKVNADGYLKALNDNNEMILEAYRFARFTGANVPHIDPLKEVNAERAKLGELGKNIPLTTVEKATEALNGGDSDSNIEQFAEEFKYAQNQGLKLVEEETPTPPAK